jgi:hypothetical protein
MKNLSADDQDSICIAHGLLPSKRVDRSPTEASPRKANKLIKKKQRLQKSLPVRSSATRLKRDKKKQMPTTAPIALHRKGNYGLRAARPLKEKVCTSACCLGSAPKHRHPSKGSRHHNKIAKPGSLAKNPISLSSKLVQPSTQVDPPESSHERLPTSDVPCNQSGIGHEIAIASKTIINRFDGPNSSEDSIIGGHQGATGMVAPQPNFWGPQINVPATGRKPPIWCDTRQELCET